MMRPSIVLKPGPAPSAAPGGYGQLLSAILTRNPHLSGVLRFEEGTFTGTDNNVFSGPMGDVPPTGRLVKVDYIEVLRFRDGKHASFDVMYDRLMMLEQLGLVPAPAVAE
jgi:ketosteroid isomerase-like protein